MKSFQELENTQSVADELSKMHSLDKTIDVAGTWWLPDKPKEKISGQLQYSNTEGVKVSLNGTFSPIHGELMPGIVNQGYPCIHGCTVNGEAVTLFNASRVNSSIVIGGGGLQQPDTIKAYILFFGEYLPHDCKFSKMIFSVPGLESWLGHKVFHAYLSLSEDKRVTTALRFSMDMENIKKEEFVIHSIEATLRCGYKCLLEPSNGYSFSVEIPAYFSVEPTQPKEINWFFEQQKRFIKMLSFLVGRPIFINSIKAKHEISERWTDIVRQSQKIELPKRGFSEYNFFISLPKSSVSLEVLCNKWFEVEPKISKPADLAMSILSSEGLWLHVKFLSLIQALEGLHRALYDGNYMQEKDYENVKKHLIDSIPQVVANDHKDALKSKIKYGNQKSLAKRLNDLAEKLSEPICIKLFGNKGKIPRSWIDTRNYYTHWDHELLTEILDNETMHYANIRMHYFILALYAQLIGIQQDDIDKALTGSSDCAQELKQINVIEQQEKAY